MFKWSDVRFPVPSLKSIAWGGFGGVVGALTVVTGVGLYIVNTLTRPKRLTTFADYTFSPYELGLPAEEVAFRPLQGDYVVSGWYLSHPDAVSTVILSPGYHGNRSDLLGLCNHLWRDGHNVLAFEYYGHGRVVGVPITLGYREINDFLGAVTYARQRAPHAHIGAVGYSMGAAVSIMGTARTPDVEALVADSAFATHRRVMDYVVRRTLHLPFILFDWVTDLFLWLRAGYRFNQVDPLRDVRLISPRPVMIIHGTSDSIVDPTDAPLLYGAAQEPKELWMLDGVEHCGAYFADRVEYTHRILHFFHTYLRKDLDALSHVDSPQHPASTSTEHLFEAS